MPPRAPGAPPGGTCDLAGEISALVDQRTVAWTRNNLTPTLSRQGGSRTARAKARMTVDPGGSRTALTKSRAAGKSRRSATYRTGLRYPSQGVGPRSGLADASRRSILAKCRPGRPTSQTAPVGRGRVKPRRWNGCVSCPRVSALTGRRSVPSHTSISGFREET